MTTYELYNTLTETVEDIQRLTPEDASARNSVLMDGDEPQRWIKAEDCAVFEIDALAEDERDRLHADGLFSSRHEEQFAHAQEAITRGGW